jgi:hypothetical protein
MDRYFNCTKSFAVIEGLEPRALMSGSLYGPGTPAPVVAAAKAAHASFLGSDVLPLRRR